MNFEENISPPPQIELISMKKGIEENELVYHSLEFKGFGDIINKRYKEYYNLILELVAARYVLNSHIYFISNNYPHDENRQSFKENINQFCQYILTRPDLLSEPLIKNFFGVKIPYSFAMLFENNVSNLISEFAPTNIHLYNNGNNALVTFKSTQPTSYIDEMMSANPPAIKATLKLCQVTWQRSQIFNEILSIDLRDRISTTLFQPNENKVIIGFENGEIAIYNTSNGQHIKTVQIMEDPIIKIQESSQDIFVVTHNNIKILNGVSYEVIGGGSLKKRLDKDKIESFEVVPSKNSFLLGTTFGNLLLYQFEKNQETKTYSLKYIQTALISKGSAVSNLKINILYLFVSAGTTISTYKIDYKTGTLNQVALFKPNEESESFVKNSTITDFYYFSEQRIMMGAYANGKIITWSVKNGEVVGIRESQASRALNFAFCPEKMRMITYGYEDVIEVWKIKQG